MESSGARLDRISRLLSRLFISLTLFAFIGTIALIVEHELTSMEIDALRREVETVKLTQAGEIGTWAAVVVDLKLKTLTLSSFLKRIQTLERQHDNPRASRHNQSIRGLDDVGR